MATELAKAYVQIIPSTRGIAGTLSNTLGKEAGVAGDSAGQTAGSNLVSKIKTAIAAAGIGMALKSALLEGADLQQSLGGIETLFKESADKVVENAKRAYETAGMSANQYMETVTSFSASLLQGLGGDTESAADIADMALTDMSDNANKMGTSMELIQNAYQGFAKQNYTMLDNLKLGYGGTKTEMERLLADAEKLSGVEYDISNLSDVYEAIHVIQEEMDITGTTAKEAASTFSGSFASMKAAANNVLGNLALGEAIGPSLTALGDTVYSFAIDNLLPMAGNVLSSLPEVLDGAFGMAIRSLNLAGNNSETILQQGIELVGSLATSIVSALPYLLEAAFNLVTSFGSAVINTDWRSVANGIIVTLKDNMSIASGEILGKDGSIVSATLQAITAKLPDILNKGVEMVANLAAGILSDIPTVFESAGTVLDTFLGFVFDNLPLLWEAGINLVLNLVDGVISSLPQVATSAVSVVAKLLSTILSNAPNLIEGGITLIGKLIAGLIRSLPDLITNVVEIIGDIIEKFSETDWGEVGGNIIAGIAKGILNGVGEIISAAKQAASDALAAAKAKLGIHSPSKVFETQVGQMIAEGMASGIEKNVVKVSDSMKALSQATVGMIDTDFDISGTSSMAPGSVYNGTFEMLAKLYALLEMYLPQLANMQLVTDTGVLAGELAPRMNMELNDIMDLGERGV